MHKSSKQREWVYDFIQNHPDKHLSAEEIFQGLQDEKKDISLATVYRNLNVLQKENRIAVLMTETGTQVYDKTCRPHDHLMCTRCHRIFDLDMPYDRSIEKKVSQQLGLVIESHALTLYGICKECLEER